MVTIELQKAAQVRSELLSTLLELEVFANQQAQIKAKAANLYMSTVSHALLSKSERRGAMGISTSSLPMPAADLELRCFPTIRRGSTDARRPLPYDKDKLDKIKLFDV